MLKLILKEIPPSNNKYLGNSNSFNIYRNEKKRFEWLMYDAIGRKAPPEPYKKAKVVIIYYFKDRKRRDPDNYSGKFILDGLVKGKIIKDDSFNCIDLVLKGDYDKKNPRVEIEIIGLERLKWI